MKQYLILALTTVFASSVYAAEPKTKKMTPEPTAPAAAPAPVYTPVEPAGEEAPRASIKREGWEFRSVVGLDFTVADSEISPQGSYSDPQDEAEVGGAAGFLARRYITPMFAMSSGGEFVRRRLTQDYDIWWVSFGGETSYDVVSFEVPIYFEIVLGGGKHVLYGGPRLATPIYQHCSSAIDNSVSAYPCVKDAASSIFVPIQMGYNLRFGQVFGLNFFIERTATPIINKDAIEVTAARTGALAVFYF